MPSGQGSSGSLAAEVSHLEVDLAAFGLGDADEGWVERFRIAATPRSLGTIGPFEILDEIGRGGQGIVYRARRTGTSNDVAVKRLLAGAFAGASMRRRFEREVRAIAALDHRNIVRILGAEVVGGQPLLIMEWIDGAPIDRWAGVASGARPLTTLTTTLKTFVQVCDAVHHAHQHGVIHRDLKPSNILVDLDGRPRVLDFGLARLTTPDWSDAAVTPPTTVFAGTPAYASPEQVQGDAARIDLCTDIYSLGVILFELITGKMPYVVNGPLVDTLEAIRSACPPRPSSIARGVDRELDAIVLKALAKAPADRYQSVDALAADVRRYLAGDAVLAHPPSALYQFRKYARRHRVAVAASVAGLAAVCVFAVGAAALAWVAVNAGQRERQARLEAQQVTAFLKDVLAAARPSRGGPDVSLIEVLRGAEQRIDTQFAAQPHAAAQVHFAIGSTYRALWRWREAEAHLRKALGLRRSVGRPDDDELADSISALGSVLTSLRDPESISLQHEALEMRRKLHGENHLLVAESLTRLAYALHQGATPPQWDAAEQYFREALARYRELTGNRHRDAGSCLHNFGWMRYRQNRLVEADELYGQALNVFRELGDLDDPYAVECMWGYCALLNLRGENQRAATLLEDTIPRAERLYGADGLLPLLWRAARVHTALGEAARARPYIQRAFSLLCREAAEQSPAAADALASARAHLASPHDDTVVLPCADIIQALPSVSTEQRAAFVRGLRDYRECLSMSGECREAAALDAALSTAAY